MARMARTQTNVTTANGGMPSVKPQSFNHVVPQIASEMTGVNPFAGDLTSAFNQFFGSVQESMSTIQAAEFQQKKIEAQDYAKEMQAAGINQAREDAMANPKMDQTGLQVAYENMEIENDNRHFLSSYKQTLGASVGDRMYGDFALHMANKPASSFEAEAGKWWSENYGNGTGDELVDQAMSAAWSRNYETARVKAAGEAIAQAKQATHDQLVNDVFRRMGAPDWNWNDYASVNRSMASLFPNETNGQVSARTLGIMKQAAIAQGPQATRSFMDFLTQRPTNSDGTEGQSLSDRFPAAVAKLRDEAYDGLMQYTTLSGQQAMEDSAAELSTIMSMPDEYDQLEALTEFMSTSVPALQNTAGVPFSQIGALRSKALGQIAELGQYKLNMNALKAGTTTGGGFPSWMTVDDAEKYASEFVLREHDFLNGNGDQLVSTKAGMALQQIYNRFGDGVIGDDLRQMFVGGLLSANPETVARTVTTLKTMDPTGRIGNDILSKNSRALGIFNAANVAPTPDGDPVQAAIRAASPEVQASLNDVQERGVHTVLGSAGLLSGDTNKELETAFEAELYGDGLRETLQETLGEDNFWQWDSWGSPQTTPQVEALIRSSYTQAVAQLRADPTQEFTLDSIRQKVGSMIQGSIWYDNGVIRLKSGTTQAEERADGFQRVPLSNAVHNPDTGEVENTSETLAADIELITSGLTGIDLTTDNIGYRQATHLNEFNGFQLIDNDTGLPLVMMVGDEYAIEQQFERGEDGRLSRLGFFKSFIENWDDQTIKFTGDAVHDQPLAEMIFGPGVHLRQHTASGIDGPIVGYELFVAPRFKGRSQYTIADIERMADMKIDDGVAFQAIQQMPIEQRAFAMSQYYARKSGTSVPSVVSETMDGITAEDAAEIESYLQRQGIMP